jgi:hypothetical protein
MPLDWVPSRNEVVHYRSGLAVVIRVMIHHSALDDPGAFAEIREVVEKPTRHRARRYSREERVADVLMGEEREEEAPRVRIVRLFEISPLVRSESLR